MFDRITFDWDWEYAFQILPQLLEATIVTVQATFVGFALSLVIGLLFALGRRAPLKLISWPVTAVIEFIRSTPLLVQLYFLFFILPRWGLSLSPFLAGVIGLGLHYGTYLSEVYRAGIDSVPKGQWEAARALNFSTIKTWRNIVLPQAIPPMIPAFGNYFIVMFKETPLLSAITVVELLQTAKIIGARSFRYVEPVTLVGLIFLLLSYPAAIAVRRLENRFVKQRA
ncbi:MAG: ectoine/hydroxyectoine ABC transporter permease subunit EhuD [Trueperaceae bacterium]|nr:ectoine/hydroxyectoine ABC transporter permease subunit EhuD [Trueperaceae bacterium]